VNKRRDPNHEVEAIGTFRAEASPPRWAGPSIMNRLITVIAMTALSVLVSGCRGITEPRYSITVISAEGPIPEFHRVGWEFRSEDVVFPEDYVLPITSTVEIVRFPNLNLRMGETGEENRQHPVRYESEWDINTGKPAAYSERGVGISIMARVNSDTESLVNVSLDVENVHKPEWKTMEFGHGLPPVLQPLFHCRNFASTMDMYTGVWQCSAGIITTTRTETNALVRLIRVTRE